MNGAAAAASPRGRRALVAGGTGLVGQALVTQLLDHGAWESVVSLVRRPGGVAHRRLDERRIDYDKLVDDAVDLPPSDDAFCCLGTTLANAGSKEAFRRVDHDYVLAFARAARRAGAERLLLVSAIGAGTSAWAFYSRVKGEVEAAVADLGFTALHIFRPSLLTGDRQESRTGERLGIVFAKLVDPLLALPPLAQYRAIPAERVASAMVGAALDESTGTQVHTFRSMARLATG